MKYDKVIILCADKKGDNGKFPDFQDGMYLGGQIRMNAAADLYKSNPSAEYFVVGGYDPKAETSCKVSDMECFLKEKNPAANIKTVKSLPCTFHNFVAVFNTWKQEGNDLQAEKIGLLTNLYHLPRALRFAVEVRIKTSRIEVPPLIPICAESVVVLPDQNMYNRETEYLLRLDSERRGLKDLERGTYDDNCLNKKRNQFIDVAKKFSEILLTLDEVREIQGAN